MADGGISFVAISSAILLGAAGEAGGHAATRLPFWLAKFYATDILVAGAGGVGKTCLAKFLADELDDRNHTPDSSNKLEKNKARIDGRRVAIRVLTGDASPQRDGDIRKALHDGQWADGIVYVVCNGFRFVSGGFNLARQPDELDAYLRAGRRRELADFRALAPRIEDAFYGSRGRRPAWLIVALSKADLYWHDEKLMDAAADFYAGGGEFAEELRTLQGNLGANRFSIDVIPVASLRRDFRSPEGIEQGTSMTPDERGGSLNLLSKLIAKRIQLAGG